MNKLKIFSLVLGFICLSTAAVAIFNKVEDNKPMEIVEAVQQEEKVRANTKIILKTVYDLCDHTLISEFPAPNNMINMTKDELLNKYATVSFKDNLLELTLVLQENCEEHYIIKEDNGVIKLYWRKNEINFEEIYTLNIDIKSLRQNDRYIFRNTGLIIDGNENLYKFLEDYDI